ncbi:Pentatricopeptide repeat-containing protein [Thalictrum thalictroides]|uniref:Pentatricopeptide repeat-containing protein n=1 Tax=Thalictrum thalictroides TaxID=46969 RepID=A0A7J6V7W9_THATH|nr:Pentatricopeptide repeat-containing protein [Thalictrum thalictroides]
MNKTSLSLPEIRSFRRQHDIYRITVDRLASAERFSSIEEILQHQKKYDSITSEGFAVRLICLYGKADVVTYNIVIQALCEMGWSFDSADYMLAEMESNGVKPNVITFNTIMHKLYDNGQFLRCNGNLDEAKKMYDCILKDGVLLSQSPFRMLIRCCYENGDLDLALKLCEENMSVNFDIGSDILQLVVDGLVKRSRVEEAERLVNATSNMYDLKLKMPSVDE